MRSTSLVFLAGSLIMVLLAGCADPVTSAQVDKPNVIVIFTDDQGSIDTHRYGATDLQTPSLDRLADTGVRFTQFEAAAPVCSPSRAGLLTGRYPLRAGVPGNVSARPGSIGMPTEEITIAEMLKADGYATALIGKWHLGYKEGTFPNDQGFDHYFGHLNGCIDNYSHFFYWNGPNRHDLWRNGEEIYEDGAFFPDLMVREASEFIEAHSDEPFFMYFAMNMPHYPYQGDAKWLEHYADLPYPRNLYAAFVSTLDERIGQLVDKLEELGLRENTLIIFQSDHGHSTEERAHNGGGNPGPFRGAKASMFEGGLRVPAIISMPGVIPQGEVRDQLAHGTDWLPTIAGFSGSRILNEDLDGKNLREVIMDSQAPSPHSVLHWHLGRNNPQWAVRKGPWKLIGNGQDSTTPDRPKIDSLFLSNLDLDISESTNLLKQHSDVAHELKGLRDAWLSNQQ